MMLQELAHALSQQFAWLDVPPNGNANLFLMELPDSPDSAAAIYQYSGEPPLATLGNPFVWIRPRIQVNVRDASMSVAMDRAMDVWYFLGAVVEQDLGDPPARFHKITPMGSPFEMSPDAAKRAKVAANYRVSREGD